MIMKKFLCILALIALTLSLRIAYFHTRQVLSADGCQYMHIARNIAAGEGFTSYYHQYLAFDYPIPHPVRNWPPLVPLIMAGGLSVWGQENPEFVGKSINLLINLLIMLPLYLTAQKLFGRTVALLSLVLYAFYIPMVYFSSGIIAQVPYIFFFIFSFYFFLMFLEDRKFLPLFLAGICAGLAYLSRYEGIALLPMYMLAYLVKRTGPEEDKLTCKEFFLSTAVFLGSFVVVALPWWVRNIMVAGTPIINDQARLMLTHSFIKNWEKYNYLPGIDYPTTLEYITGQPVYVLKTTLGNLFCLVRDFYFNGPALFVLGNLGLLFATKKWRKMFPFWIFIIFYFLFFSFMTNEIRYLFSISWIWLILSAYLLHYMYIRFKDKARLFFVLAMIFFLIPLTVYEAVALFKKADQFGLEWKEAGFYLKDACTKETVIMARKPVFSFYAGCGFVSLPYAETDMMAAYCKKYDVRFLVYDERLALHVRPWLSWLLEGPEDRLPDWLEKKAILGESPGRVAIYRVNTNFL